MGMERIDRIIGHPLFDKHMTLNREAEKDRRFCRHDMAHFLDVARIARIMNLEEGLGIEDELIYAAALLHDIGRHLQYFEGISHEQASAGIAPAVLKDCGFTEEETISVTDAIAAHRDGAVAGERSLRGILYRADKASRPCFCCDVREDCSWKQERKNMRICY